MKTILVTHDFSKNSNVALRYAVRLNQLLKYKLIVFHCTFQSPYTILKAKTEDEREALISLDEKNKTLLLKQKVLAAYKYIDIPKIPSSTYVFAQFNPMFTEKTLEIARSNKVELIIMGTHGASGLNKFFFGSNTSSMISISDIPVLAVPVSYRHKKIKTLLYSSDIKSLKDELPSVVEFAKPLNAKIEILYLDYGIDYNNINLKKAEKIINDSSYKKIRLVKQKASDKPLIKQVRAYLNNHNQELLVMFTKERSFWQKFISGSKTVELAMKLPLPLLSIKKNKS